jgi:hypothetical protein
LSTQTSAVGNPEATKVIPYSPDLNIQNIGALPRGVGAKFLVVIPGSGDALIAKRWARAMPSLTGIEKVVVMVTRGMNPRKKIGGGLTAKKLEKFLQSIPFLPSGITVIQGGPGYQKRWARHLAKEKKELARLDAEYYKEFPEMRRYHPKRSTNPRDERSRMAVSGQRHG